MRVHHRDLLPIYFEDIKSGRMKFDVRRELDKRGFWVGDIIIYRHNPSDETITCKINYLYNRTYGLWQGHVILGIEVLHGEEEKTANDEAARGSGLDAKPHTSTPSFSGNENVVGGCRPDFQRDGVED